MTDGADGADCADGADGADGADDTADANAYADEQMSRCADEQMS